MSLISKKRGSSAKSKQVSKPLPWEILLRSWLSNLLAVFGSSRAS